MTLFRLQVLLIALSIAQGGHAADRRIDAAGTLASVAPFTRLPGLPGAPIGKIAVDPSHPDTLYAGVDGGGGLIFKSTDAGANWTTLSVGGVNEFFRAIAVDPKNSDLIFAFSSSEPDNGVSAAVYESENGGKTWTRMASQPIGVTTKVHAGFGRGLLVDSTGKIVVAADKRQGIFHSANLGKSWTNPLNALIYSLVADSNSPSTLWAGGFDPANNYNKGLWKSVDFGQTWVAVKVSAFNQTLDQTPLAIGIQPKTGLILVGYYGQSSSTGPSTGGIVASADGGKTWKSSSAGLATGFQPGNAIVFDPTEPGTIYLSTDFAAYPGTIYRSTDKGAKWAPVGAASGLHGANVFSMAAAPVDGGFPPKIYSAGETVFSSTSHGMTWTRLQTGLNDVAAVQILGDGTATGLYGLAQYVGLFRKPSSATGWRHIDTWTGSTNINAIAVDLKSSGKPLYAVTSSIDAPLLRRSSDKGAAWTSIKLPLAAADYVSYLIADPVRAGRLYAVDGGNPNTLLRSDNAGATWKKYIVGGPTDAYAEISYPTNAPIVLDPNVTGTLYAALGSGLWKSVNAGASWRKLTGLTVAANGIAGLTLVPGTPKALYVSAGTGSSGNLSYTLMKSINGGTSWAAVTSPAGTEAQSLLAGPTGGRLFAFANCGLEGGTSVIAQSTNGGKTWSTIDAPLAPSFATGTCPTVMPAPAGLYVSDAFGSEAMFSAPYAKLPTSAVVPTAFAAAPMQEKGSEAISLQFDPRLR